MRKLITFGATHRLNAENTFSADVMVDLKMNEKNKGINGSPVSLRYGGAHKLKDNVMLNSFIAIHNNTFLLTEKFALPIDAK